MAEYQRVIQLAGARNFRDLGGYVNQYGQTVSWGKIYRAADLSLLTQSDRDKLSRLQIKHDVDLRSTSEQERNPDRLWSGAKLTKNPIYPEQGNTPALFGMPSIWWRKVHHIPEAANGFAQIYQNVILNKHAKQAFATTFKILLQNEPTLFHCSAGKDRTGMTAALVLLALEVPEETIIADYLLTNELFGFGTGNVPEDEAEIERLVSRMNLQTGEAEVMQTVIETINVGYGGIANYWQDALGLKLDQLQKLRKLYLVDDD